MPDCPQYVGILFSLSLSLSLSISLSLSLSLSLSPHPLPPSLFLPLSPSLSPSPSPPSLSLSPSLPLSLSLSLSRSLSLIIGVHRPAIVRDNPAFILHYFPHSRIFYFATPCRISGFISKKIAENRNNFSCTDTFCSKKLCETSMRASNISLLLITKYVKDR